MKRRTLRRAAPLMAVIATLLGGAAAASVAAAQTTGNQYDTYGQYGEIARFGGFDTAGYDSGNYDLSDLTSGKFVDPVGFTVDANDDNTVYVLDRVSANLATTGSSASIWRLQQLSDTGTPIASSVVTLTAPTTPADTSDSFQLVGLAVDHNTGEVYSLVDESEASSGDNVPYEIVAWSTDGLATPTTDVSSGTAGDISGEGPVGFSPAVTGSSAPAVVSYDSQIVSGETAQDQHLYNPQGIAVDDQSGQDALAIEAAANDSDYPDGGNGTATIVQQVATSGSGIGNLLDYWSSATGAYDGTTSVTDDSLSTTATTPDPNTTSTEDQLGPAGISSVPSSGTTTGGLTILLDDGDESDCGDASNGGIGTTWVFYGDQGCPDNVDVVTLTPSLGSEKILASQSNELNFSVQASSYGSDLVDGVAIDTDDADPPYPIDADADFVLGGPEPAAAAGPQVVALDNGLYAADYAGGANGQEDGQSRTSFYWLGETATAESGNEGIRLLEPEAAGGATPATDVGTLSNSMPPLTSVYDTLGNANLASADACNIADYGVSVAAGADGAVFVLMNGIDTSDGSSYSEAVGADTREIVELAPTSGADAQQPDTTEDGDAGDCPTASGTFGLSDQTTGGSEQPATVDGAPNPLTVSVGATVAFDGSTVDYPAGDPFSGLATTPTAVPYAFDWYSGGMQAGTIGGTETPITFGGGNSLFDWPTSVSAPSNSNPATTFRYTTPGVYYPTLDLVGDYGSYVSQGEVVVQAGGPPTAVLPSAPVSGTVGQPVTLDGSGSAPYNGTVSIVNYHWDCGNGQTFDTTTPTETCTYSTPNTYTVTLTVRDDDNQVSPPATETVNIAAASTPPPANTNTGTTSTPPPTTTTKTTPPPPVVKITPPNDVLPAGVTSAALTLQFKSVKVGTKLTVKLTEPKVKGSKSAKAKVRSGSTKVGSSNLVHFSTGKLPVGVTTIRFYETVGKGKKAKQVLVKTETVRVSTKKK